MSARLHHHRERETPLSNSSASSSCEPHEIIPLRASATVGPEPWEADGCLSNAVQSSLEREPLFV